MGLEPLPSVAVREVASEPLAGPVLAGAAGAPPDSMKLRMSFFVTRPPRPVPCTWLGSTPCSEAILATTGDTNVLPFVDEADSSLVSLAAVGAGVTSFTVSALGGVAGASETAADSAAACAVAGSGTSSFGAAAAPSPPMTASFVPTSTVSPSCTRICVSVPEAGLGTSVSTLSVEISSSDSSAATSSPSCFSHLVTVPSETDTPICGMTTSIASVVAISLS